jgi:hypothetical protein
VREGFALGLEGLPGGLIGDVHAVVVVERAGGGKVVFVFSQPAHMTMKLASALIPSRCAGARSKTRFKSFTQYPFVTCGDRGWVPHGIFMQRLEKNPARVSPMPEACRAEIPSRPSATPIPALFSKPSLPYRFHPANIPP